MRALIAQTPQMPNRNARASLTVSGRRMAPINLAGEVMLMKQVLKNAPTVPCVPRSSHGVPTPAVMGSKTVFCFFRSEAISIFSGGRILDIRHSFHGPNADCRVFGLGW